MRVEWKAAAALALVIGCLFLWLGAGGEFAACVSEILVRETEDETADVQMVTLERNGERMEIELEEYLKGVVGSEMTPSYEMEALKAQAVASRTFVLSRNLKVDNTTNSQVYLNEDQMIIIKAAANQLGNALERELTYLEQEKIKVAMEREHMLNSMLRSISHDLRTPLTGIVGASQLMMNQEHLTNEDVYSLAKDIHDQAHWLTQIVENILNMSKIESGNLVLHKNLEVVDDLIYEAIQHLPELEKRNVVVDVPQDLLFINVDGKLMVQVFINILNNAIKYTKEKDQITIHVKKLEDEVQFMIKDTGTGISKKILDDIFEEFVTDTNVSNDSQKGIGLGLAICKAIIQAHGGKIWAKNEKDGACFIFTIPSDKELNV